MAESHVRAALGRLADAEHLLLHMGLYDGDYLVDWLGGVLKDIGIKATNFDITSEQQETLFMNGQNSARRWLDRQQALTRPGHHTTIGAAKRT